MNISLSIDYSIPTKLVNVAKSGFYEDCDILTRTKTILGLMRPYFKIQENAPNLFQF